MISLPSILIEEKNKLMSDGAWLVLLDIELGSNSLSLVRNTEKIVWNGKTYLPFNFDIADINESAKGEIPSLSIKVSNVAGQVQKYVDIVGGGIGAQVYLRVVHSKHLDIVTPDLELEYTVEGTETDLEWVTFNLGGDDSSTSRFPQRRIIKDFCPYTFKGIECGYRGVETKCLRTLVACRAYNNSERFGGESGIPLGGIYASNA